MTISEKYQPYVKNVLNNKTFFEDLLDKIKTSEDSETKQEFAKRAISFALANSTGYYSSNIIETVYLDIAQDNTIENLPQELKPNSFLHVMTESYPTGGHTQVVERWIDSADKDEIHSLAFTGCSKSLFIPERLQNAVKNKNGNVFFVDNEKTDIEKGLELRKIASAYQTIVLHIHMYDVIPLIAFGNTQFKRPIIFYNHADHLFWVGASIADIVAELKENGKELTINRRGVKNSSVLGVPVDVKNTKIISKNEARKKLNIPEDKKIILTIATAYKYKPILDLNFLEMVKTILNKDKNVICLGIGPDRKILPDWKKAEKQFKGQIMPLGTVEYTKLYDYIFASDIIIDGIPFGGGTALVDVASCNQPILFINNPLQQFDYIVNSVACCKNIMELAEKAYELLYNEEMQKINIQNVREKSSQYNLISKWKETLKSLISTLPKEHSINKFESKTDENISDRDVFCYIYKLNEKENVTYFKIPFIVKLHKIKDSYSSRIILEVCNKKIIIKERIIKL